MSLMKIVFILLISLLGTIFIFLILFSLIFIKSIKANNYVKKHYYQKWCKYTSLGIWGPGAVNPFEGQKYLWNDLEDDDEQERIFKIKIRQLWKSTVVALLIMVFNIILLIAVAYIASRI